MKLYYIPMACSLVAHIALRKAGVSPELVKYDPSTGMTDAGEDFKSLFPKAFVPVVIDDTGEALTEVVAILLELDARYPDAGFLPKSGAQRRRAIESLCYISAELHKKFLVSMFSEEEPTDASNLQRERIATALSYIDGHVVGDRKYVFGPELTAVDIYLVVILLWAGPAKVDLTPWPSLIEYRDHALNEAPVIMAMDAEGLL